MHKKCVIVPSTLIHTLTPVTQVHLTKVSESVQLCDLAHRELISYAKHSTLAHLRVGKFGVTSVVFSDAFFDSTHAKHPLLMMLVIVNGRA